MPNDKPETSFEPEEPTALPVDPVALLTDALAKILALLDERLPAAGGLLGAMPPMENPRLFTVWTFPAGYVTCDDQYGRGIWALCGKYTDVNVAVLAAAKGYDDITWYGQDDKGRGHEVDRPYFTAGQFGE